VIKNVTAAAIAIRIRSKTFIVAPETPPRTRGRKCGALCGALGRASGMFQIRRGF
jgi:hypothetical protein